MRSKEGWRVNNGKGYKEQEKTIKNRERRGRWTFKRGKTKEKKKVQSSSLILHVSSSAPSKLF